MNFGCPSLETCSPERLSVAYKALQQRATLAEEWHLNKLHQSQFGYPSELAASNANLRLETYPDSDLYLSGTCAQSGSGPNYPTE